MILNREKRKRRRIQTDEAIHIVALWNLMLILIPFLLLSAAFSQTSILNLMVPSAAAEASGKKETGLSKEPIHLVLNLNGFILTQGPSRTKRIPLISGHYDLNTLLTALTELKKENPTEKTVILSSASRVPYEVLVQAMDQCREADFPNMTLGADSPGDNL